MKKKVAFLLSIIIALVAVYLALTYQKKEEIKFIPNERPIFLKTPPKEIGKEGSTHEHISLYLFIDGEPKSFFDDKYMLRNQAVHFENSDGVNVHKHATGVTLPYFFSTLGMILTKDCLVLDTDESYCDGNGNKLSFLVNGEEGDPFFYEIRDGDRVLVSYGNEDSLLIRLRANSVPPVPEDILNGTE